MRVLFPIAALLVGVVLGATVVAEQTPPPPAAYVLIGGRILDPDPAALDAYREAAGPKAVDAGIEVLARGEAPNIVVLEGDWPYRGFVAVERFRSMDDLLAFWYSPEYRDAVQLREGKIELDFVVALNALQVDAPQ
jgi:uncharacterized protein (DUF1330 family)